MQTTLRLYNLSYSDTKTYLASTLFVLGNIALPQIAHLIPQGGMTLLPIYFFTLIGAYKYGWQTGMLTAIASPIVNSLLFGMPMLVAMPAILTKSIILAIAAGFVAHHTKKVSIPLLILVVMTYQLIGTLAEWGIKGDFYLAIQDFRIGVPGMLLQIFGGYVTIKYLLAKL